jgi:hypothetical protein
MKYVDQSDLLSMSAVILLFFRDQFLVSGVKCAKLLRSAKPVVILAISLFCGEFFPVIPAFAHLLCAEKSEEQNFDTQQKAVSATSLLRRDENGR